MPGSYILTVTVKGHMMVHMTEATAPRQEVPAWTLGWKLKRALDFADVTAQEMASELGVHVGTVSRWMNDREEPRRAYVMAWALRCGVPFEWFAEGEEGLLANSHHKRSHYQHQLSDSDDSAPSTAEITSFLKSTPLVREAESPVTRSAAAS